MITIYHNPRCRKSREGLDFLEKTGKEFEVVRYLEEVPTKEELKKILGYLALSPTDVVRKNEAIWKENYKGKSLSDEEILDAMVTHPKLLERPIIINGTKAVIGRPKENIADIL